MQWKKSHKKREFVNLTHSPFSSYGENIFIDSLKLSVGFLCFISFLYLKVIRGVPARQGGVPFCITMQNRVVVINFLNKVDQVFFETSLSFLLKCNVANDKHICNMVIQTALQKSYSRGKNIKPHIQPIGTELFIVIVSEPIRKNVQILFSTCDLRLNYCIM